jgi:hypothetical protein
LSNHGCNCFGFCHIRVGIKRLLSAAAGQIGDEFFDICGIAKAVDHHARALICQFQGNAAANAAG